MDPELRLTGRCLPLFVLALFLLPALGCGPLLSFIRKEPPPAPPAPVESVDYIEAQRQIADAGERVCALVWQHGTDAHAVLVAQARDALAGLSGALGRPVLPITLPDLPTLPSKPLVKATDHLRDERASNEALWAAWRLKYEGYRTTPVESGWQIKTPLFAIGGGTAMVVLIALGGLQLLGVPVIGLLFKALISSKRAIKDTVAGVQAFLQKDDVPVEAKKVLRTSINGAIAESSTTEAIVTAVKKTIPP